MKEQIESNKNDKGFILTKQGWKEVSRVKALKLISKINSQIRNIYE